MPNDETLSEILAEKYDIYEDLVCEGTFVRLFGMDREAVGLVTLGLTTTSLVIARPDLSGDRKDYDLLNMFPLDIVTVTVLNYKEQTVSVRSDYKTIQIYQLCSSEDQTEVWDKLSRYLDNLKMKSLINEAAERKRSETMREIQNNKCDVEDCVYKQSICTTLQPVSESSLHSSNINSSPVEIQTFNKQFSKRTFKELGWFPRFSYEPLKFALPNTNCDQTGKLFNWCNKDESTKPLISDHSSDTLDSFHGQSTWSSMMTTVRDIFCCYW